ncbi:MAG: hypothetical protein ABI867_39220 [Kofleriaceae bacterium]
MRFAQNGTVFEVELVRDGLEVVELRHGPTESDERRSFASERLANRAYHERIAELVEIGWDRRSGCETVEDPGAPELVAAMAAFEPDAVAVYTDLLLERGDPRGELATLHMLPRDAAVTNRIAQLEQDHGCELFGPLATLPQGYRDQYAFGYTAGWVSSIELRYHWSVPKADERSTLYFLIHAPVTRFVHTLALDGHYANAALRLGCEHLARIRSLRLSSTDSQAVLDVFPGLEHLEVPYGAFRGHPSVRHITLAATNSGTVQLAGSWPSLERVTIEHVKPLDQRALRTFESDLERRGVTLEIHVAQ